MNKILYLVAFLAISLTSCDKNELTTDEPIAIKQIETHENIEFGIEYPFADTLRVYANDTSFVDIKISSNKEEVLKSHLAKFEPYLKISNNTENTAPLSAYTSKNTDTISANLNPSKMDVIVSEVINQSNNILNYAIGYHAKTSVLSTGIQKVTIYPNRRYYEYKSRVHDTYYKIKMWHVDGVTLSTRMAFAFLDCWLCTWRTTSFTDYQTYNWLPDNFIFINPWANDGSAYNGDRKYKLAAALYSQTPSNHEVKYSTYPIGNW